MGLPKIWESTLARLDELEKRIGYLELRSHNEPEPEQPEPEQPKPPKEDDR